MCLGYRVYPLSCLSVWLSLLLLFCLYQEQYTTNTIESHCYFCFSCFLLNFGFDIRYTDVYISDVLMHTDTYKLMRIPFFFFSFFPTFSSFPFPCYWIVIFFWKCNTIVKITQNRVTKSIPYIYTIYSQTIIIFTLEYWSRRYSSLFKIDFHYLIEKNRFDLLSVSSFHNT